MIVPWTICCLYFVVLVLLQMTALESNNGLLLARHTHLRKEKQHKKSSNTIQHNPVEDFFSWFFNQICGSFILSFCYLLCKCMFLVLSVERDGHELGPSSWKFWNLHLIFPRHSEENDPVPSSSHEAVATKGRPILPFRAKNMHKQTKMQKQAHQSYIVVWPKHWLPF